VGGALIVAANGKCVITVAVMSQTTFSINSGSELPYIRYADDHDNHLELSSELIGEVISTLQRVQARDLETYAASA
jgi:hypothetical protein